MPKDVSKEKCLADTKNSLEIILFNGIIKFTDIYGMRFAYSNTTFTRGCKGFDGGLEPEVACRVTLGHVKTGEFKINANDNYALAA